MKKLLLIMLTLVLAMPLFAIDADAELGYREAGISNYMLYPEGNFYYFPSRLSQLEQKLLWTHLNLYFENFGEITDTMSGGPTDGGVITSRPGDFAFDLDGSYYFSLENDMVLGFRLNDEFTFNTITDTEDDGYTTDGEKVTVISQDNTFDIDPQVFFAMPIGDELSFGAQILSTNTIDPVEEEFEQTTDSQQNDGDMYYSDGDGAWFTPDSHYSISGVVGLDGVANNMEWGVSVGVKYDWENNDRMYVIDSDGDGFADKIVDFETYVTSDVADGGLGADHFESVNKKNDFIAAVNGYGKLTLDEKNAVLATLSWTPYDIYSEEFYVRTDSSDKSSYTYEENSNLANFNLGIAYARDLNDKWSLRVGSGVEFMKTTYSQKDLDFNGDSTFDSDNGDNYEEVTVVGDLDDGDVISVDWVDEYSELFIPLQMEVRFAPAKAVNLFSRLISGYSMDTNVYKAFNTNDDSVWTEEDVNHQLYLISSLAFGADVALNENLSVILSTYYQPAYAWSTTEEDDLPNDGSDTSAISNLDESTDTDITINLNFVWRF